MRTRLKILLLSTLNTLFLLWATFVLLNIAYPYDDESVLIKWTSVLRNTVQESTSKPKPERFVFVNVAWDKALIPKYDDEIPEYKIPIGVEPITDREKLLKFFRILNQKPDNHKFLMCDVFFAGESAHDSLLQVELRKMKNYCVSYHKNDEGALDLPMFEAARALADYEHFDDLCLKFRIFHDDSLVSVPLYMYQQINGVKFEPKRLLHVIDGKTVLNSFILDHRVRNYDFWKSRGDTTGITYNMVLLGELLLLDEAGVQEMMRDKIIVLGDFINDAHETIYGEMPGSVILLNAYLALEAGENVVSWPFILFLTLAYFFISYRCFDDNDAYDQWIRRVFKGKTAQFIVTFTGYALVFGLLSVISYLIFNKHLTILVLAIYMNVLEKVYSYLMRKFFRREAAASL